MPEGLKCMGNVFSGDVSQIFGNWENGGGQGTANGRILGGAQKLPDSYGRLNSQ